MKNKYRIKVNNKITTSKETMMITNKQNKLNNQSNLKMERHDKIFNRKSSPNNLNIQLIKIHKFKVYLS